MRGDEKQYVDPAGKPLWTDPERGLVWGTRLGTHANRAASKASLILQGKSWRWPPGGEFNPVWQHHFPQNLQQVIHLQKFKVAHRRRILLANECCAPLRGVAWRKKLKKETVNFQSMVSVKFRTTPIRSTIKRVRGLRQSAILYKCPASTYWQFRVFLDRKPRKRSTKQAEFP
jgi:hypothetical protein